MEGAALWALVQCLWRLVALIAVVLLRDLAGKSRPLQGRESESKESKLDMGGGVNKSRIFFYLTPQHLCLAPSTRPLASVFQRHFVLADSNTLSAFYHKGPGNDPEAKPLLNRTEDV